MIDDILDYSKIEAGKLELEQEPFDLRECVEGALDIVAPRASEKEIELGCLIDEDVPARSRGRRGPAAPGAAQPGLERGQVHRGRRGGRPRRCRAHRGELVSPRARRSRHRGRHSGRPDGQAVRVLQPGRRLHHPPLRRYRARARDLEASRRADGRDDVGGERGGQGIDLPHRPSGGSGRGADSRGRAGRPAAARRQADPRGGRQRHEPRDRGSPRAIVGHGGRGNRVPSRGARSDRGRREVRRRRSRLGDAGDGRAHPRTRDPAASRRARASSCPADLARPAAPGSVIWRVRRAAGEAGQGLPALQRLPESACRARTRSRRPASPYRK